MRVKNVFDKDIRNEKYEKEMHTINFSTKFLRAEQALCVKTWDGAAWMSSGQLKLKKKKLF